MQTAWNVNLLNMLMKKLQCHLSSRPFLLGAVYAHAVHHGRYEFFQNLGRATNSRKEKRGKSWTMQLNYVEENTSMVIGKSSMEAVEITSIIKFLSVMQCSWQRNSRILLSLSIEKHHLLLKSPNFKAPPNILCKKYIFTTKWKSVASKQQHKSVFIIYLKRSGYEKKQTKVLVGSKILKKGKLFSLREQRCPTRRE